MNKIQSASYKFLLTIPLFIIFMSQSTQAQELDANLSRADSLFETKRYVQAFEIYQDLLEQEEQYTPAMLLKMAYIQEGLGAYEKALFYLSQYQQTNYNQAVLRKMENLATEHKLNGYSYTEQIFFLTLIEQYRWYFVLVSILLSGLFFFLAIRRRKQKRETAFAYPAFYLFFLGLSIIFLNLQWQQEKGIVMNNYAVLMEGPSAGTRLLAQINRGHRVKVLGQEDVWVKIQWDEQEAYIRENHLKRI